MARVSGADVFPALERVRVRLRGHALRRFVTFVQTMGWADEDALRILLAYPAVVARGRTLSAEEVRDELGAARGELATLRHRAYMADEAIRTLEMNVAGFTASLQQFDKLLPQLEREEADLRAQLGTLPGHTGDGEVEAEDEDPDPVAPARSLFDFFRRHAHPPHDDP